MAILLIGLLMLVGLTLGMLGSYLFRVPRVVGCILAGVLFSPDLLGNFLGADTTEWPRPIVAVTLGIIAYLIGGAATVSQLRQLGWTIVTATLGKVTGSFVAVLVGFSLLGVAVADVPGWSLALLLAAIATSCLVPGCNGPWYEPLSEEDPWLRYFINAPRPRTPSEKTYSDRQLRSQR